MDAKYQEVLKQYNFKINNTLGLGAHIIETNEGPNYLNIWDVLKTSGV